MTVEDDIRTVFDEAGVSGFLHARPVGSRAGAEVDVSADARVVLASVFKIPVAVAVERAVSAGELLPHEQTTITARYRRGGVGLAGLRDDAVLTWRDLAHLMLTLSDNAATDALFHRVGQAAVDRVLADLGLAGTRIDGCCEDIIDSMVDELGIPRDVPDIDAALGRQPAERLWALSALDPTRSTSSTPREMTTLIDALWTDRAAPPDACARVRAAMAQRVWPHRLSSGFPAGVRVAGKTGTLPAIRNEVGAVTYPDGRVYAVAVFTRADSLEGHRPEVDRAIGVAARLAVDALRDFG
ncbi:serine hydrolase [Microbacterium sp. NPDC055910]|uniref:serine hydrolase n=1 Tax=Microbacterium sp. NPDC055910 TaxID=3345659 RepID=UPI0035E2EA3F